MLLKIQRKLHKIQAKMIILRIKNPSVDNKISIEVLQQEQMKA